MLRFISGGAVDELCQGTPGFALHDLTNASVHRPTGTAGLNGRSRTIEAQVADLGLAGGCAMVNLSIHDQTTAHTAAERNIKCRIISLAGTLERLTQRRDVRVVIHARGHPRKGLQPSGEVEFGPTFNLMRATDFPGFPIDWSSKTHANRSR